MKKQTSSKTLLSLLLAALLFTTACTGGTGDAETESTNTSTEAITEAITIIETIPETEVETVPDTEADTEIGTEADTETDTEAGTEAPDEPAEIVVAGPEVISFDKNINITSSGSKASVKANDGLAYTAEGYKSVGDGAFVINKGFTVNFPASDVTGADFNRFSICYVSTQPLKGTVTYTENDKAKTDDFFLESGEHTFSCVTTSYLDGIKGKDVASMTFETCNGKDAEFALCLLKTYDYPVYTNTSEDTYYVSNDRYKLGIRLCWGGGINYLRDLENKNVIKGVNNLINQADTGRLVQQSYYGTISEGDYQAGVYNGSQWRYNPVQGGDKEQNHSRIIDIVVTEHSVYVKSQPMDWSLDGQITPSYMENSYTLYEDHIRVDNRFVDYSGMKHPFYHQELPAFYTLSCFDRFNWYDGSKGWTDDTLSYRDDLGFWGDSRYYEDCTFLIKESNTETWCAWTHSGVDYGIGLYVPNADSYLAGRHAYNGSTDSMSGATNYVAPVNTKQLVSYEALEYSYLMATGSVEEIRATFKANKDFSDNATLHENYQSRRVPDSEPSHTPVDKGSTLDLSNPANQGAVTPANNAEVAYDGGRKALKLTVKGGDPNVNVSFASLGTLSTSQYNTLVIEYMIPTTTQEKDTRCDLFVCAGSVTSAIADCCVRKALVKDGQFHTIEVDLSGYSWWTGNLNSIRFDFLDVATTGDVVYVKTIGLK
ncbi:MAG: hypothetical protein IJW00_01600 [Clostridia bacterium]|nr:hypothetical protein [Clostridia bacterium]